jgi:hypothetical protein
MRLGCKSELLPVSWTRTLSRAGHPLELHRADIADGRVAPLDLTLGKHSTIGAAFVSIEATKSK